MDDHILLFLVLFPLLSVGGICLVMIGRSGIRTARKQAEQERARASGTVVDLVRRHSLGRGKPFTSFYPVVEFPAGGQTLRHESREGYMSGQFSVGERVEILYDADDPSHFHLEKEFEKNISGCRVTVFVGILWIVIAAIAALIVSS